MHLLKEENSARTPENYTSQAHEKFSYVFQSVKKSSKAARKQTPKRTRKQLFGGFTDDNVEVPLRYSPKTCKSHDDLSANTGPEQSNIGPNYEEAQELLDSNGLGDFLPKLYQALVNGLLTLSNIYFRVCVDVVRFLTCTDARTFRYQE